MSVATGLSPAQVGELSIGQFDVLVQALDERWSVGDELAAQMVEQVHELRRVVMAALGAPAHELPKALRVPRPGDTPPGPRDRFLETMSRATRPGGDA